MIKSDSIELKKSEKVAILLSSFVCSVCLIILDEGPFLPLSTYIKEFVFCSLIYTVVMSVPVYGTVMFYKSFVRDLKYEITVFKSRKKAE